VIDANSRSQYSVLSLFTGAGALDQAFERTGQCSTALAIEADPVFCETLSLNRDRWLPHATIRTKDIAAIDPVAEWTSVDHSAAPSGIIGGPPCQAFSRMGRKRGVKDFRGLLVFTFHAWVDALKPTFFVMENVPDLETRNGTATIEELVAAFQKSGYHVSKKVLNAADFGAATKRKRIFIVGFRDAAPFSFPAPTHSENAASNDLFARKRWVGAADALAGLPDPVVPPPHTPQAHQLIAHTPEVIRRFATIAPGGYDHVRKRARLHPAQPSPSLVAGDLNGIRWAIHPSIDRELTNREAARLHGFPDWFVFAGNHAAIGVQIANAVPIPLGSAVAAAVIGHLNSRQGGLDSGVDGCNLIGR
jgi:DNA (cytosine-5)-methyltransferase 1